MPPSDRLTERENQVFEFIRAHLRDAGRPPTLAEIGRHLGLRSSNSVHKLLVALEARGAIARVRHEPRGITVLDDDTSARRFDDGPPSVFMPRTVSSAAARAPLPRGRVPVIVDPRLLPRGIDLDTCLAVLVADDGMTGDGIRRDDFAVVEETPWADVPPGTIVAVFLGERAVVRRLDVDGDALHLRASDRTYRDESFAPDDARCYVVGVVRALLRTL